MKALRDYSPQARHHFTRFDQVDQLVRAALADPDTGFMARLMMLCSLPRTNPGSTGTSVQARQRPFHPDHDGRGSNRACPSAISPGCCWPGFAPRRCGPNPANWFWALRSPGSCAGWAWLQSGVAAGANARGCATR